MKSKPALLIGSLCLALGPQLLAQNFIMNGDFEAPALPSGTASIADPTGWSHSGQPPLITSNGRAGEAQSHAGEQYIYLAGNGNLVGNTTYQDFSLPAAERYSLTWFDNSWGGTTAAYTVNIRDSGSAIVATGTYVADPGSGVFGLWNPHSLNADLGNGSYTLEFVIEPSFSIPLIDDVALVATPVPEPAEYAALVGLALVVFGAGRRIRKQ